MKCNFCYRELPDSEFRRQRGRKCRECSNAYSARYTAAQPEKVRKASREHWRRQKARVVELYGGGCECCGESNIEFLHIDHVLTDGAEERRRLNLPPGARFHKWLANQPVDRTRYQILCANCHAGKSWVGSGCPHNRAGAVHDCLYIYFPDEAAS